MAPYYEHVAGELGWIVDDSFLAPLKTANEAEIARLSAVIQG